MIQNIEKPDINFLSTNLRTDGISGFIRCKNEGEYLEQVIDSWIDLVDELIIVFNDCIDNSEDIIEKALLKYPNKIKAYHYLPKVFAQGTDEYRNLEPSDYQSLVNYYNFALNKTTKKWCLKIDGDIILDSQKIQLIKKYHSNLKDNECLKLSGVNIIKQKDSIFCLSQSIFCGTNGDLCIFKMQDGIRFEKESTCEYLNLPKDYIFYRDDDLKVNNSLTCYYHMKFQKSDFGFGVYDFKNNKNSNYYAKTKIFIFLSTLLPLKKVFEKYQISMRDPNLFIKFHKSYNDYKREFKLALKKSGGKNSFYVWFSEIKLCFKINAMKAIKRLLNE